MKLIVVCFMFGFYCFCWKFSLQCSLTLLTGRPGLDPWVGKISWRRKWQPTPVILPGKFHERRTLVGYSPLDCKELHTTEQLYFLHYNSLVLSELSFKTLTAYLPNISDWTNGCCRWKHTFDLMVSLISMWKTDWAELLIQASNSTILFCCLEGDQTLEREWLGASDLCLGCIIGDGSVPSISPTTGSTFESLFQNTR